MTPPATPVVLLHGFMGCGEDWLAVARCLEPRFRCLMPDLPGHDGRPPPPVSAGDPFAAYVDRLWTMLQPRLPESFCVAGYSLGGRLGIELACRYPDRVRALVLESAHPGLASMRDREARWRRDRRWIERFRSEDLAGVLEDWYRQPVFSALPEQQRQAFVRRRSRHRPEWIADVLEAISTARQPDRWGCLRGLAIPVGYVAGELDPKYCAVGDRLAAEVPGLTLVKLAGVGHNCHTAAPEAVAGLIAAVCGAGHAI